MQRFYVGIDPGVKNFGISIITPIWKDPNSSDKTYKTFKVSPFYTKTCDISNGSIVDHVTNILLDCSDQTFGQAHYCVERYVSYGNVHSPETERVTSIVGMIEMFLHLKNQTKGLFNANNIPVNKLDFFRAIDWKTELVQNLAKYQGFLNPSDTLDKKFSLAAARFISNDTTNITDSHTADATCIAYMGLLKDNEFKKTFFSKQVEGGKVSAGNREEEIRQYSKQLKIDI